MTMARWSRAELRTAIYKTLLNQKRAGATRKEIAEIHELKKTPHLTGVLNDLVNDGWLEVEYKAHPNGLYTCIYKAIRG